MPRSKRPTAASADRLDGGAGRAEGLRRNRRTGCPTTRWMHFASFRRHQGAADHAHRRRHPFAQRGPAADLDLYTCLRPVRYFTGVPSPVKHPEKTDMVIFRENSEDIYAGIEFEHGTDDARKFKQLFAEQLPRALQEDPLPRDRRHRHQARLPGGHRAHRQGRHPIRHRQRPPSVTLVHKGNIMKFTEGAFMRWGYEVAAKTHFGAKDSTAARGTPSKSQDRQRDHHQGRHRRRLPPADPHPPRRVRVIATMNLNGDYISDALAACVGGIGIAPGGNINYDTGTPSSRPPTAPPPSTPARTRSTRAASSSPAR
jgi:isocitrate dehydrogenase